MATTATDHAGEPTRPPAGRAGGGQAGERGWDVLLADAIRVLSEAARLRRPRGTNPDDTAAEDTGTEPVDFAEFTSLVLAATAANVGGIERLLAGRPGSWEADHLRNLLTSTVGWHEEYLWGHRTEPVLITVPVDYILFELGIWELFDDSARELWRRQEAVGDDLTEAEREAELDRLAGLEDDLETLMAAEWVAYGNAFEASVLAELDREPIPGLRVPVEFDIDARPWQPYPTYQEPATGPLARLSEAGWANTPLPPGSGIAPKDYPNWGEIENTERDAGRLPHLRVPTTPPQPSEPSEPPEPPEPTQPTTEATSQAITVHNVTGTDRGIHGGIDTAMYGGIDEPGGERA